ncbi:MAG: hypothetical protein Q4D98_03570 [Planctomycetia bacterium]|nr:hypothetical protein [Planctomycetia bacterium]
MSAESIKLGEVFTSLTVQSDGLQQGLADASEKIRKFGQRAEELHNFELLSGNFVQGRGEYDLAPRPYMRPALVKGKLDMVEDSL